MFMLNEIILEKSSYIKINYKNFDRMSIRSKFQDCNKKSIISAILISQSIRIAQQNRHLSWFKSVYKNPFRVVFCWIEALFMKWVKKSISTQ